MEPFSFRSRDGLEIQQYVAAASAAKGTTPPYCSSGLRVAAKAAKVAVKQGPAAKKGGARKKAKAKKT